MTDALYNPNAGEFYTVHALMKNVVRKWVEEGLLSGYSTFCTRSKGREPLFQNC